MSGQTVLLFADDPQFFERRDTWFNRRGVDAFGAMNASEVALIAGARNVHLLLSKGAPSGMSLEALRTILPVPTPLIILNSGPPDELASYIGADDVYLLEEPFQDRVMDLTAKLLTVPTRHYLRILVQLKATETGRGGTFGFSNNLSASGMLLETRAELEIGNILELSFLLPGARQMTEARAKVVREAGKSRSGSKYGVQFQGLSSHDQLVIHNLTSLSGQTQGAVARG